MTPPITHQDVLIIGGGFTGQLAASLLSHKGYAVLLAESTAQLGGRVRLDEVKEAFIPYGFHLNLLTPELAQRFDIKAEWCSSQETPVYYEKKVWHAAQTENLTEEQKHYNLADFRIPKGGIQATLAPLLQSQNIEVKLNEPIVECEWNGDTFISAKGLKNQFKAKAVLFAMPFKEMSAFLDESVIEPKFLKLCKGQSQTMTAAVKLDFLLNGSVSDQKSIIFDHDNNGVGLFLSNIDPSLAARKQLSQWLFFLTEEELRDKHEMSKKIRAGKRQIKKSYPEFFEKLIWERLTVQESVFPKEALAPKPKKWSKLNNHFWISGDVGVDWVNGLFKEVEAIDLLLRQENKNIS